MPYEKARAQLKYGASRPTLYQVEIPSAIGNSNFSTEANEYLKFFCKAASIPGVALDTISANGHERNGVYRTIPANLQFQKPFSIRVIERSDFLVYKQMREWLDSICKGANQRTNSIHRMSYYNNITCDIVLHKFEYDTDVSTSKIFDKVNRGDANNEGYATPVKIIFKNAFITNLSSINLSSASYNTFTEYSVDFDYETYYTEVK